MPEPGCHSGCGVLRRTRAVKHFPGSFALQQGSVLVGTSKKIKARKYKPSLKAFAIDEIHSGKGSAVDQGLGAYAVVSAVGEGQAIGSKPLRIENGHVQQAPFATLIENIVLFKGAQFGWRVSGPSRAGNGANCVEGRESPLGKQLGEIVEAICQRPQLAVI